MIEFKPAPGSEVLSLQSLPNVVASVGQEGALLLFPLALIGGCVLIALIGARKLIMESQGR